MSLNSVMLSKKNGRRFLPLYKNEAKIFTGAAILRW